jgi:hypothetical protein
MFRISCSYCKYYWISDTDMTNPTKNVTLFFGAPISHYDSYFVSICTLSFILQPSNILFHQCFLFRIVSPDVFFLLPVFFHHHFSTCLIYTAVHDIFIQWQTCHHLIFYYRYMIPYLRHHFLYDA